MTTTVANRAIDRAIGYRPRAAFPRARDGFEALLRAAGIGPGDRVLMPAYIGWSSREGSGVHDPVAAVGASGLFVRVDQNLRIDFDDYRAKLALGPRMVVLIHYFGAPDPSYREMAALAREAGVPILEDEAHALFTDLVAGTTGRLGDAVIFSLHKQLPCLVGGELRLNPSAPETFRQALEQGSRVEGAPDPSDYDLDALASRRRENFAALHAALFDRSGFRPLWEGVPIGVVPQTYPLLVENADRDELYDRFNAAGWGGTSLYHTMIPEITIEEFPDSHRLARTIFNLPLHQDADPEQMRAMADALIAMLS